MEQNTTYTFEGFIQVKSQVILNFVMLIIFICAIYLLFPLHKTMATLLISAVHLFLVAMSLSRAKKSKVTITETQCQLEEYKLFGIIKIYRCFEIVNEERGDLLRMFQHLSSNKQKIRFFTIDEIDNTLNQKIIFHNINLSKLQTNKEETSIS